MIGRLAVLVFAALLGTAQAQSISGGGSLPPVVEGGCIIGTGGAWVGGSCSGSGTPVTSVTGTANKITASPTTGAVVLTLPAAVTLTTSLAIGGPSGTTAAGDVNITGQFKVNGTALVTGGSGIVNSGTGPAIAQYLAGTGTTVGPATVSQDATIAQGGALTIAAGVVTNAKLVTVGPNTMKGNWTGLSAAPSDNLMPQCLDSGSQHLNYVNGTGVICGTSSAGAVTSVTGTSNQIAASPSTGAVVLSLPATVSITTSLAVGGPTGTTSAGDVNIAGVFKVNGTGIGSISSGTGPAMGQYPAGTGTTISPVTISQDATIAQGGALTIAAGVVGNAKLATVGPNTIKGNWTGLSSAPSDNAMPTCLDTSGQHLNYLPGTGVTCGTSAAVAVTSVSGTANQIAASPTTGAVVLSLPAAVAVTTSLTVGGPTGTTSAGDINIAGQFKVNGTALVTGGSGIVNSGTGPAIAQYLAGTGITVGPATISQDATIAQGGALTIAAQAITNAKLVNVGPNTMKGNWTGSSGQPADNLMPTCLDAGGNHLNYLPATGITCGTSAAPAVTTITGTANQIAASASTGAVTLSLPATVALATSLTVGAPTGTTSAGDINIAGSFKVNGVAIGGASAVSSVTGTANQITASPTTGSVVLSLPAALQVTTSLAVGAPSGTTAAGDVNITGSFKVNGVTITTGGGSGTVQTVTLAPGLTTAVGTQNTGSNQITIAGTINQQLWPVDKAGSYSVVPADTGNMLITTAGSVIYTLPNPAGGSKGTTYQFGSNGAQGFTLTTVSGSALIYGCLGSGAGSVPFIANIDVQVVDTGSAYKCSAVGGGTGSGTVSSGTGPAMAQYSSGTGTVVAPVTISQDATIAQGGALTIAAGVVGNAKLTTAGPNTMKGNWTGSTSSPSDNLMPPCADTGSNHLNYVNGQGITCGTSAAVVSVTGTANQIAASPTTGAVVLSLPATVALTTSLTVGAPSGTTAAGDVNITGAFKINGTSIGIQNSGTGPAIAQYPAGTGTNIGPATISQDATIAQGGALTINTGVVSNAKLTTALANTMKGNWTGSTAAIADNLMPQCLDSGSQHLNYVNGQGITCGTSSPVVVTSITGTANQITASAPTGAVTLSLPAAVQLTTSLAVGGPTGTTSAGDVNIAGVFKVNGVAISGTEFTPVLCTGTTATDTAALQAVFTAGRSVKLLPGPACNINATLAITTSQTGIMCERGYGKGWNSTVVQPKCQIQWVGSAGGTMMSMISPMGTTANDVISGNFVSGISFNGNGGSAANGLVLNSVRQSVFEGNYFVGFNGGWVIDLNVVHATSTTFVANCDSQNNNFRNNTIWQNAMTSGAVRLGAWMDDSIGNGGCNASLNTFSGMDVFIQNAVGFLCDGCDFNTINDSRVTSFGTGVPVDFSIHTNANPGGGGNRTAPANNNTVDRITTTNAVISRGQASFPSCTAWAGSPSLAGCPFGNTVTSIDKGNSSPNPTIEVGSMLSWSDTYGATVLGGLVSTTPAYGSLSARSAEFGAPTGTTSPGDVNITGSFKVNGVAIGAGGGGSGTVNSGTGPAMAQYIAGTGTTVGPVTISGDATIAQGGALAIGANKITNAMIRQGVARSVVGVTGNTTANVADIQGTANQALVVNAAGTALAFGQVNLASSAAVTGTIMASSFPALTGPVTTTAGSLATTVTPNGITSAMFRQGAARSVVGVTGNATANVADIAGTTDQVLRVTTAGTGLGFGAMNLGATAAATGFDTSLLSQNTGSLTAKEPVVLTDAPTIAVDLSQSHVYTITETASGRAYQNPTNGHVGDSYLFLRTASGTGITPSFGTAWRFQSGGVAPNLSSTNADDMFGCVLAEKSGSNVTKMNCNIIGINYAGGFNPTSLVTTQLWLDASDLTTVFTGTSCTGGNTAVNGAVGSWRDKSANALCFQATGTQTLRSDGNNHYWVELGNSGVGTFRAQTGTGLGIAQNKPIMAMVLGGQFVGGTATVLEILSSNGNPLFTCGFNANTTGEGPGLLARRQPTDSQALLVTGSETGSTGAPKAVYCDMEWQSGDGFLSVNNGTTQSNLSLTSNGNSDTNPANGSPYIYNDATASRVYYIQAWTPTAPPGPEKGQAITYTCQKMNITC